MTNIITGTLAVIRNAIIGVIAGFAVGFFGSMFNSWNVIDVAVTGKSMMDLCLGGGIICAVIGLVLGLLASFSRLREGIFDFVGHCIFG